MSLNIFERVNDFTLKINDECLLIREFRDIYKNDKTRMKETAFNKMQYIFLTESWKSPYFSLDVNERKERALKDCGFKPDWKPGPDMVGAIKRFEELQNDSLPTLRLLRSEYKKLAAYIEYNNNVDFMERDEKGQQVNNPNQALGTSVKIGPLYKSMKELEEMVMLEEIKGHKIRGQNSKGTFEDGY